MKAEIERKVAEWRKATEHNRDEQGDAARRGYELEARILGHRIEVRERCANELESLLSALLAETPPANPLICAKCGGAEGRHCICDLVSAAHGYALPTDEQIAEWKAKHLAAEAPPAHEQTTDLLQAAKFVLAFYERGRWLSADSDGLSLRLKHARLRRSTRRRRPRGRKLRLSISARIFSINESGQPGRLAQAHAPLASSTTSARNYARLRLTHPMSVNGSTS